MIVNALLVRSYATNVYLTGKNTLSNIKAIRPEYVEHVMKYAASNYFIDDIDRSLSNGLIDSMEHADTIALKSPEDPQYRSQSYSSDQ